MKTRPILFSAPMVRALLNGSKTQTRRVIKPQPEVCPPDYPKKGHWWPSKAHQTMLHVEDEMQKWDNLAAHACPYGQVGDQLWVRETFMSLANTGVEGRDKEGNRINYAYAAESSPGSYSDECRKEYGLKWKPSIHMPRAASRITLEITGIRVERLNDCSEQDAIAEGISKYEKGWLNYDGIYPVPLSPIDSYQTLWESINGAGSWAANPWVWVVEFKVVKP
jgi:hypothetical protein